MRIEGEGTRIHCTDFRGGQRQMEQIVFKPRVIDVLSSSNSFEYIIVPTISSCLKEILPVLKDSAGKAHILFFQNMWDDFNEIARYLLPPFVLERSHCQKNIWQRIFVHDV